MTQRLWLYALIAALAAPASAAAQSPRSGAAAPQPAASPTQGVLQNDNQDQPIQIDAATLDVRDKEKMAIFSGDVQVVQGDTTIKCQNLKVLYGPEPGAAHNKTASAAANASQDTRSQQQSAGAVPTTAHDIRRIEASGGVTVVSKDQNATGDVGVYDLKKKTITLTGNVTVSQGKNVLHGDKVIVDTTTGNAHFTTNGEAHSDLAGVATPPSRVRALILPSKDGKTGAPNIMSIGPAPKAN